MFLRNIIKEIKINFLFLFFFYCLGCLFVYFLIVYNYIFINSFYNYMVIYFLFNYKLNYLVILLLNFFIYFYLLKKEILTDYIHSVVSRAIFTQYSFLLYFIFFVFLIYI